MASSKCAVCKDSGFNTRYGVKLGSGADYNSTIIADAGQLVTSPGTLLGAYNVAITLAVEDLQRVCLLYNLNYFLQVYNSPIKHDGVDIDLGKFKKTAKETAEKLCKYIKQLGPVAKKACKDEIGDKEYKKRKKACDERIAKDEIIF